MFRIIYMAFDRVRSPTPTLCVLLLAAVLWLLNHPYVGFSFHDARIYSLLALHWLDPSAYARDPFFMFGSQDDFTIFSPIYGTLIRWCGLSLAAQIMMVAAATLWIGAAWMLARRVFDDWRVQAYVVLSLAIYSFNYSPNNATFVLNESFATARVIAIPLMLMAMAFSLERKWMLAGVMALLSMAIHPLLGIWGVVLMMAVKLNDRVLLGLLVAGAATIVGASLMPGPAAFHVMDAEWAEMVRQSSRDVFVGPYGVVRLNATLFWIAALLLGGRFGSPRMQRWYQVTALVASYGFLLAQLCSNFYPIQLVMQAQPWRAMWLAIYFGIFALADVGQRFVFGERNLRVTGLILVVILFVGMEQSAALLLGCWLLLRGKSQGIVFVTWRKAFESYGRYITALAFGLILAVAPTYYRELAIEGNSLIVTWLPDIAALNGLLIVGGLGLGPLVWCSLIGLRTLRTAMTLLLLPGVAAAAMHWDHRSSAASRMEKNVSVSRTPQILKSPVRKGEVVLWPGNSQRVLFELGTASYASSFQAIGIVLSREKTHELALRLRRMAIASTAESWPLGQLEEDGLFARYRISMARLEKNIENLHDYEPTQLTGPGIRYACEDPALDWVVSSDPVYGSELKPITLKDDYRHAQIYFYWCDSIRQARSQ